MKTLSNTPIILNVMFLKWDAGTENAFLNYAIALQRNGYKVINLVHPNAQIIKKLKKHDLFFIKTKLLGKFGKCDPFAMLYFRYLLVKYNVKIIFAHQGKLISLFKKAKGKKQKLIAVNHGHNPKHSVGSDHVITINSHCKKETIRLGQGKDKISVLPNAIGLNRSRARKTENEIFAIGSYGRFSPEKGYDDLVKALNILFEQKVTIKAIIGGTGSSEDALKERANKNINFTGWVDNQEEFLSGLDLFVLPSKQEEFGLAMIEAMKYRVPVLATKCYGPLDVIKDGYNGYLTEIADPIRMAEKIKNIIKDNEKLNMISEHAYETLTLKYSMENFTAEIAKIIKNSSKEEFRL